MNWRESKQCHCSHLHRSLWLPARYGGELCSWLSLLGKTLKIQAKWLTERMAVKHVCLVLAFQNWVLHRHCTTPGISHLNNPRDTNSLCSCEIWSGNLFRWNVWSYAINNAVSSSCLYLLINIVQTSSLSKERIFFYYKKVINSGWINLMVHLPCGKSKENTRIELYKEIIAKYVLKWYFVLLNKTQFSTPKY